MSKAQHTPGPWQLSPYYDRKGEPVPGRYQGIFEPIPGVQYGSRSQIVGVGIKGDADDYWLSIKPVDAALISAAPKMLDLLERLDDSLESLGREIRLQIRAVIAEATET